jgi:hypothetical protein
MKPVGAATIPKQPYPGRNQLLPHDKSPGPTTYSVKTEVKTGKAPRTITIHLPLPQRENLNPGVGKYNIAHAKQKHIPAALLTRSKRKSIFNITDTTPGP